MSAYVCRVVGPAGAVRYLGKDFAEVEFTKDAIHWETFKDAWASLVEFSFRPEAMKLYADVIDPESGEVIYDSNEDEDYCACGKHLDSEKEKRDRVCRLCL